MGSRFSGVCYTYNYSVQRRSSKLSLQNEPRFVNGMKNRTLLLMLLFVYHSDFHRMVNGNNSEVND